MRSARSTLVASIAVALLAAACSSSGSATPTPAGGGGGSGTSTGSPGGNGGNVAGIDACSLLTPAEIQQALGVAVKAGVLQTADNLVDCEWDNQNESDAASVGVTVQTYDDSLWQAMSSSALAKPISGFGEAAYTDYPHPGDISIKQGGFEIDLGLIDFTADQAKVDAAAQTLAKLVLGRV